MGKPFSNVSPEEMLDNFSTSFQDGYAPQLHSGFYDLGQCVAMILTDDYLATKYGDDWNIVSMSCEQNYVEEKPHILEVNIELETADDIDDENSPKTTSFVKLQFTEEEVTPLMDVILSRWKRYVFESTRTKWSR